MRQAPVMTPWAQLVDPTAPLPDYPRPQMVRGNWLNLNGIWEFQVGGVADPVPTHQTLSDEILVPFPMESALSGVAEQHPRSWYRRLFEIPTAWAGQKILLHLEAVDWESEVFVDGVSLGIHKGGYDRASYDITARVTQPGPHELIVRAYDPTDLYGQPRGKQTLSPGGIMYTSCSGIWQTVWLEPVPQNSVTDLKLVPDIDTERLNLTVSVTGADTGLTVTAIARDGTTVVGTVSGPPNTQLRLSVPDPKLWSPNHPFLYDLEIKLSNGPTALDAVTSYFGMRKISLGTVNGVVKMLLNNEFVFQFGPLDQGFWPDGIYTAPTDDALKSDIEQSKLLGFNMIRKHIKVEPARWYYWADKLGMLVWQDMPSVNSYTGSPQPIDESQFHSELTRVVESRGNSPAIVSWVVFNESQGQHNTTGLVADVKALDPSRLVNQASGGSFFGVGDILDDHSYPNPSYPVSATQAVVCGEFGGIGLGITNHTWAPGWGYVAAADGDALATMFGDMCLQLSDQVGNHGLSAAVYTEITDVEIELNGFLTYDRHVRKPDADRIRASIAQASTPITVTPVLATSETVAQTWSFTTTTPAANWFGTDFNASAWSSAQGGFGSGQPAQTAPWRRTPWTSSDIWMRRNFNLGNLSPQQLANLRFTLFNDEDVQIYINGVLAGSATGYRTSYSQMDLTTSGRAAIITNGSNLLAVHCHQSGGGQFIDVGLGIVQSNVVTSPRPQPGTPAGLIAASGRAGISLGWTSAQDATAYRIKRATHHGGPYTDKLMNSPLNSVIYTTAVTGTTYYYVVSSSNASGESSDSAEISVAAVIPPLPPPTLAAWFRADTLGGFSSGDSVATWPDSSGSGHAAEQNQSALRPSYQAAAINGLPVVRFNAAAGQYLSFTRPVKNDFTIFCVFRSGQGTGTGNNFWNGAALVSGERPNAVSDFALSLNAAGRLLAGTGNPDITIASAASGFNNSQAHVVAFKRARNSGSLELFADGVAQGAATAGQQALIAPATLALGAHPTLINPLTGDIAEVKIYDGVLTSADCAAVNSSLAYKYGLGPAVPPRIPGAVSGVAGDHRVMLSWAPVIEATTYIVRWSATAAGPFTVIAIGLTTEGFVDLNAIPGQTNYYKVVASGASGNSPDSATSVLVPVPALGISTEADSVTLRWPEWADTWSLHSSSSLALPQSWSPVTTSPVTSGGMKAVTLPRPTGTKFFRLVSPSPSP